MSDWAHISPSRRNLNLVNTFTVKGSVPSPPHLLFCLFALLRLAFNFHRVYMHTAVTVSRRRSLVFGMLTPAEIHVFPSGLQLSAHAAHSESSLHHLQVRHYQWHVSWKTLFFSLFSLLRLAVSVGLIRSVSDPSGMSQETISHAPFPNYVRICMNLCNSAVFQSLFCSQIPILSGSTILFWDKVCRVGCQKLKDYSQRLRIVLPCWWRLHH